MNLNLQDLSSYTPVQIDTELAALYEQEYDLQHLLYPEACDHLARQMSTALGLPYNRRLTRSEALERIDEVCNREGVPGYLVRDIRKAEERMLKVKARLADVREQQRPLDTEYRRRRWTRAFLAVTNSGGHVHSSMGCSTCFPTTQFAWMVEYSGKDEAEIVADAGERACTVCYPSAPAEVLNRPTKMFSKDERDKQQAREEREAKRAAKAAAQITLTVYAQRGYDGPVGLRDVTWKTTRALQNDTGALVREMAGAYAMVNGFNLDLYRRNPDGPGLVDAHVEEAFFNLRTMLDALKEREVDTEALVTKNFRRGIKEGNRQPVKVDGRYWDGTL